MSSCYLYTNRTLTLRENLTVTVNTWELVTALFPRPTLISVDLFSFSHVLRNTFPAGLCCHFHLKHLNISVHSLVVYRPAVSNAALTPQKCTMYTVELHVCHCTVLVMSSTAWHNLSCFAWRYQVGLVWSLWQWWPDVLKSL